MSPSEATPPADPRARAAQTKRDRTRRALLDAADSTFGSRGWARTRMEDIAATAGVSPATAYNHFPTKHALLGTVYGPLVRPLVVQAERDIAAGRSMVDALIDQLRALSRTTFRNRKLTAAFWAAVQEYTIRVAGPADPDDDIDPRVLAPIPDSLRMIIECGQQTGELRTYPGADELSAMTVNILMQRAVNFPDDPPETAAELLLTVVFGSLKPELLMDEDVGERPFRGAR
ncbi:TetR/AcrR family transcriptional regulator [Pseudonocardia sp. GCM10023141]|uniref:TetR/AcrR family transcriptional regulator n=1 Tax=Pseudonocardia sp. GCM10023141 TaxID=3252653 RepID=UPI003608234C